MKMVKGGRDCKERCQPTVMTVVDGDPAPLGSAGGDCRT